MTDNSANVDPNAKINLASSQEFPIGVNLVEVAASDNNGNTAICRFNVRIAG